MIRLSADMDKWFDALSALEGPGVETVAALSAVVEDGFMESQGLVHVRTGSLKNSGRTSYEITDDEWTGEITYGGPSPGSVNNPVTYANEELTRGGAHDDFFQVLDFMYDDLEEAIFTTVRARGVGS